MFFCIATTHGWAYLDPIHNNIDIQYHTQHKINYRFKYNYCADEILIIIIV